MKEKNFILRKKIQIQEKIKKKIFRQKKKWIKKKKKK